MAESLASIYGRLMRPRNTQADLSDLVECTTCGGRSWVILRQDKHPLDGQWIRCPGCTTTEEISERLHVPMERMSSTFKNFDTATTAPVVTAAASIMRQWSDTLSPPWVVLCGPVGSGKSYLMYAAALKLLQRGYSAPVHTSARIIGHIQRAINSDTWPNMDEVIVSYAQQTWPLIIDEWGLKESSAAMAWWERILGHRYEAALPTAICTNALPEDIERLSLRMRSRMEDKHISRLLVMHGAEDYRKRK